MKIPVLAGDGIGPRSHRAGRQGAARGGRRRTSPLELVEAPIGGAGSTRTATRCPTPRWTLARKADAILFGAAGVPGRRNAPVSTSGPGASLLRLRKALDLFANFRPAVPVSRARRTRRRSKPEVVDGPRHPDPARADRRPVLRRAARLSARTPRRRARRSTRCATPSREIERIAHVAFRTARTRKRKVCSVDKANVLETMAAVARGRDAGRRAVSRRRAHALFVDAAAMKLMRAPQQFDVMVTGNMFGDILSDAAAMLTGSIGMLPSASLDARRQGAVRAGARHGAGHRGQEHRQSAGGDPVGGDDAAPVVRRDDLADADRARGARGAGRRAIAPPTSRSPGTQRVGTREMGDAVVAALRRG